MSYDQYNKRVNQAFGANTSQTQQTAALLQQQYGAYVPQRSGTSANGDYSAYVDTALAKINQQQNEQLEAQMAQSSENRARILQQFAQTSQNLNSTARHQNAIAQQQYAIEQQNEAALQRMQSMTEQQRTVMPQSKEIQSAYAQQQNAEQQQSIAQNTAQMNANTSERRENTAYKRAVHSQQVEEEYVKDQQRAAARAAKEAADKQAKNLVDGIVSLEMQNKNSEVSKLGIALGEGRISYEQYTERLSKIEEQIISGDYQYSVDSEAMTKYLEAEEAYSHLGMGTTAEEFDKVTSRLDEAKANLNPYQNMLSYLEENEQEIIETYGENAYSLYESYYSSKFIAYSLGDDELNEANKLDSLLGQYYDYYANDNLDTFYEEWNKQTGVINDHLDNYNLTQNKIEQDNGLSADVFMQFGELGAAFLQYGNTENDQIYQNGGALPEDFDYTQLDNLADELEFEKPEQWDNESVFRLLATKDYENTENSVFDQNYANLKQDNPGLSDEELKQMAEDETYIYMNTEYRDGSAAHTSMSEDEEKQFRANFETGREFAVQFDKTLTPEEKVIVGTQINMAAEEINAHYDDEAQKIMDAEYEDERQVAPSLNLYAGSAGIITITAEEQRQADLKANEEAREQALNQTAYRVGQAFETYKLEEQATSDPDFLKYAEQGIELDKLEKWQPFKNIDDYFSSAMMSDEERAIYRYYLAKEGEEAADEYYNGIAETLNERWGVTQAQAIEGMPDIPIVPDKQVMQVLYGAYAGVDQFESGIEQLFYSDALPTSSAQFAAREIREDLGDNGAKLPEWLGGGTVGQLAFDVCQTAGNVAPTIAVGYLFPPAGAALAGLSAKGNAYNEALKQGYSKEEAEGYSWLVGISEGGLQYALGGFAKLGGKLSGKAIGTMVKNIDSAFLRIGAKITLSGLSEGFEEQIQNTLNQAFRNMALGENNEIRIFDEDTAYNYLLSVLTVGVLEGHSHISSTIKANQAGNSILQAGKDAELIQNALTLDKSTNAYQLANQIAAGKTKGNAINIGELLIEYVQAKGDTSFVQQPNMEVVKTESIKTDKGDLADTLTTTDINETQAKTLNSAIEQGINTVQNVSKAAGLDIDITQAHNAHVDALQSEGAQNKADTYNTAIRQTMQSLDAAINSPNISTEQRAQLEDAAQQLTGSVDGVNTGTSGVAQKPKALMQMANKAISALQSLPAALQQKIGYDAAFESYLSAGADVSNTQTSIDALMQMSKSIDMALASGQLSSEQAAQLQAVQAEIAEVVGVDAMGADNGNDADGVVELGGENSQDADIAKKIKHLENFARENGIKELSLASEEILKTSGGRIDLAECLILATKEVIAGKSVKELADYYELTDNPADDSLSIYQARIWYLWQESLIKSRLDYSKSLEQVAHDAFDWRNYIRTKAREAMSDRAWAEYLMEVESNWTFDDLVEHYTDKGYFDEALWLKIIESAQKSRDKVNRVFGLEE